MPEPDSLHLVLHKCRGEATLEVALRWDFGTPSDPAPWWLLQSTGSRVYPYWTRPIEMDMLPYPPPEGHRDFFQANPTPSRFVSQARVTPKFKTVADLL